MDTLTIVIKYRFVQLYHLSNALNPLRVAAGSHIAASDYITLKSVGKLTEFCAINIWCH